MSLTFHQVSFLAAFLALAACGSDVVAEQPPVVRASAEPSSAPSVRPSATPLPTRSPAPPKKKRTATVERNAAPTPYGGPLWEALPEHPGDDHPPYGAASRALECDARKAVGIGPFSSEGLLEGSRTAEGGLREYLTEEFSPGPGFASFRVEKRDNRRVLFSYDVGGRTRMAVIVVDERDPKTYMNGWGAETVAWCDPSEFEPFVDDLHGIFVWSDRGGRRVDTRTVMGWRGAEHCSWTSIEFLTFKADQRGERQFLRDPDGVLADYVRVPYEAGVRLPAEALDSGYRRAGGRLWLTEDAAYYVKGGNVERWGRVKERIGCA